MPALTYRTFRGPAVIAFTAGVLLLCPAQAFATYGDGDTNGTETVEGGQDGQNLSATAGAVVYDRSKNGSGQSAGPVAATTSWTPPACWYAPTYSPAELQKVKEPVWEAGSTGYEWDAEQRKKYLNEDDHSKDFNKDKTGKGYWWGSYVNKSYPPGWDACKEDYFWVDTGAAPPANIQNVITPEILAGLAYNEIRVPGTKVTLAPAGGTKVNLPTWAWLDAAQFKPVSVTASVPVLNMEATTVAEPVSLRIEPGTADAQVYPASGVCTFVNGRIGEPYATGKAGQTPTCGVKYLRSSGNGSYALRATITWKIHWTGTGVNAPQALPDGEFGAEQAVVVQEIQAVNR
ncbi:hypothetical protein ACKI1I_17930 [Streptomyces turgidiscabies]|uniref:Enoyl reductase n=1 Tax=Streptomyces turgidiscabies (strain Car8) TaxID=698760 RepID=L7FFJ5_STRT8|nr:MULTISPECIES: hypothetical protein [Streptomyces]ELP69974.1 hypothetical protein STRTUCAR8_07111 [Streptomyces turgidiscabies Car8]MDX3498002.1 hypothetical protein [Streptomyces turgidiscabies]GAQ69911.1 hypothetical protein T45_01642 [Streptomyces turgidiscabies]